LTDDFDRILDHLVAHELEDAASRMREVISAIDTLEQNPLIGRPSRPISESW
jgi:plasmid stabilization system protein ParE